jgi:hypothetical protein
MRKKVVNLKLSKETLRQLDLTKVSGAWGWTDWPCPAPDPETRGFTNCEYCGPDVTLSA